VGHLAQTAAPPVPFDLDDRVWIDRIRAGDVDAFEAVFRRLAPALRLFTARYVGSREVAEDVVQDLFLTLWRNRETIELHTSLQRYLFTAARNRALNHLDHERVVRRTRDAVRPPVEHAPTVEDGLLEAELARGIEEAIAGLPARARLVFTMSREQKMTYDEIARTLGLSVKTVETHMGRALRAIRLHLREFFL
jgi:RNA polymerase sigma-70 factor (ECF subfamily)